MERRGVEMPLRAMLVEGPEIVPGSELLGALRRAEHAAEDDLRPRVYRADRLVGESQQLRVELRRVLLVRSVLLVPDLPLPDRVVGNARILAPEVAVRPVAVDEHGHERLPVGALGGRPDLDVSRAVLRGAAASLIGWRPGEDGQQLDVLLSGLGDRLVGVGEVEPTIVIRLEVRPERLKAKRPHPLEVAAGERRERNNSVEAPGNGRRRRAGRGHQGRGERERRDERAASHIASGERRRCRR